MEAYYVLQIDAGLTGEWEDDYILGLSWYGYRELALNLIKDRRNKILKEGIFTMAELRIIKRTEEIIEV